MIEIPFDATSCREAFSRLDDYLDRELTPGEMEGVRRHLEICAMCADEFRVETEVLTELKTKIARVKVPLALGMRIRSAIGRAGMGAGEP